MDTCARCSVFVVPLCLLHLPVASARQPGGDPAAAWGCVDAAALGSRLRQAGGRLGSGSEASQGAEPFNFVY